MSSINFAADQKSLLRWYQRVFRPLPWRQTQDPYQIWISETMLQQTTVQAVVPYFERFLERFPHVDALAQAPLEEVLHSWAGLGYYNRAKNLHKAAQIISRQGFPRTHEKLLELPGFGPYTSRAVASLAFEQKVGVLDGNVIRVLCRKMGWSIEWWKTNERQKLQNLADQLAQVSEPHMLNQALMELGATVCTPRNPTCHSCPWSQSCSSRAQNLQDRLPLPRPKKEAEIWLWETSPQIKKDKLVLIQNLQAPFLKNEWIFPGVFKKVKSKPKGFQVSHGITKYQIFVKIKPNKTRLAQKEIKLVAPENLSRINPSSLLTKVLNWTSRNGALFILFILMACQHKPSTSVTHPMSPDNPLVKVGARPLTFLGENSSPSFSPTGDRLLFISKNRNPHKNAEVYQLEFANQIEKRMTFQDADIQSPIYFLKNNFSYSSPTDEWKENLVSREDQSKFSDLREIYVSDFVGHEITRWTKEKGFDGLPTAGFWNGRPCLFFFSKSLKPAGIYRQQSEKEKPILLFALPDQQVLHLQYVLKTKSLYWLEKNLNNFEIKRTVLAQLKAESLFQSANEISGFSYSTDLESLVISQKSASEKNFKLILYNLTTQCKKILLDFPTASLVEPSFQPSTANKIVLTEKEDQGSQIFLYELPENLGPCINEPATSKIEAEGDKK